MAGIKKIALVTGGNKGVGFGACQLLAKAGVRVILTARSEGFGGEAADKLRSQGLDVHFHQLDITNDVSVYALKVFITEEYRHLDILINNAAILNDRSLTSLTVDLRTLKEMMDTNVYGALRVSQALVPLLKASPTGRIVNVSSWFGSMANLQGGGYAAYRMTKATLNALTQIMAEDLRDTNVTVNAACPGWVRTDMGAAGAPNSWEEGADTPVWLALQDKGGPNKGFFQDRKPHAW
ncbi:MAG: SDR family oxidoreductase [Nitrospinaceae bacterium]|nr:SDR family oxidoreductase [Nitrospinaceae bacterium]MBT3432645.1 SDR family oxidoreductase [Nitrospinaceae bacterium]MBT3820624.1 SDR family oxidoreductase [Nitrospinaceae bacterium]MBT4094214.1 SDR family oxidoreductase [Nitrospinaceae bacterium]MBT4430861.1 SDR family oxidoreductase [Nitrospinaceae bacterium]